MIASQLVGFESLLTATSSPGALINRKLLRDQADQYQAITSAASDLMWVQNLLVQNGICPPPQLHVL